MQLEMSRMGSRCDGRRTQMWGGKEGGAGARRPTEGEGGALGRPKRVGQPGRPEGPVLASLSCHALGR